MTIEIRTQEIMNTKKAHRWKKGRVVIILLTLAEGVYANTLPDSHFNS